MPSVGADSIRPRSESPQSLRRGDAISSKRPSSLRADDIRPYRSFAFLRAEPTQSSREASEVMLFLLNFTDKIPVSGGAWNDPTMQEKQPCRP